MTRFADAAARLAGEMAIGCSWTPEVFWAATPADVALIVRAARGDGVAGVGRDDLERLMEAFPDG